MPSISHRASLGQGAPHRAESGSAALPAGLTTTVSWLIRRVVCVIGAPIRWCASRLEDWRELRQLRDLDDHLLRDIGPTVAEAQRSRIFHARRDPTSPAATPRSRTATRTTRKDM